MGQAGSLVGPVGLCRELREASCLLSMAPWAASVGSPRAKPPIQQKTVSFVVKEGSSELKGSWFGKPP